MSCRLTAKHSQLGLSKMRSGRWGRVQVAVQRAFISNGRPITTTQIGEWTYVRTGKAWQRAHVIAVASRVADRVGRLNPGGIL